MKPRSSISEKSTDYRDTRERIYEADSDGNLSDSDRDVETRHVHTRKSLTYKSGGKLRDDKHEDSNKRDDTGSIDWSDGDRSTESYQSLKRRSLDHQRNFPKCVDADRVGNYRSYFTDSGDDLLDRDKERRHSRRRKHSRHQTEPIKKSKKTRQNGRSDSEKSDPKRDKTDNHSSRRSHSKKEKNGTDYRHSKSKGDGECSNSGQYDERYKRMNEQDRWKPINAEEDRKSGRKTNSICSGRSKSQDFDSESYDNEKNGVDQQDVDCCSWDGVECNETTGHVIKLDLSNSGLHGTMISGNSLFHLVHLKWLNLAHNCFNSSEIPSAIKNLSELSYLNLSGSSFSGQIPFEILELSNQCLLRGKIPSSLGNLTKLVHMDLSFNELSDKLPATIGNLNSLEVLDLSTNNFSSELPSSIGDLNFIDVLDLSSNGFSGELPASIGNIEPLEDLSVSRCSFSGSVADA
ncbi:Leucine-rich repeat receptor-like protein kinase family protein [Melia azedarach]|uniref:Leucine-rich repeat receptor-like protein kinase family protein n=1 Tax=Melia azedarach TaxID=155640 RepID=A0ACC1Y1L1_MELAZ|nr:Leucine-rich repeat receptor-like protein kinase family protein [Melia azedarach]